MDLCPVVKICIVEIDDNLGGTFLYEVCRAGTSKTYRFYSHRRYCVGDFVYAQFRTQHKYFFEYSGSYSEANELIIIDWVRDGF